MKVDDIKCPVCGCRVNLLTSSSNNDYRIIYKEFYLRCENCHLESRRVKVSVEIFADATCKFDDSQLQELMKEWGKKNENSMG